MKLIALAIFLLSISTNAFSEEVIWKCTSEEVDIVDGAIVFKLNTRIPLVEQRRDGRWFPQISNHNYLTYFRYYKMDEAFRFYQRDNKDLVEVFDLSFKKYIIFKYLIGEKLLDVNRTVLDCEEIE